MDRLLPWYELVEAVCMGLVVVLPLLRLWASVDRRSRIAALGGLWRQQWAGRALLAVIAASIFFIAAEDALDRAPDELLPKLDVLARGAARVVVSWPGVRLAAGAVNDLTGPGLAGAILTASIILVALGRRRETLVLVTGALGAWALSAALKLAFAVSRPRSTPHEHAITGYGFPSAHVFVTLVAAGLIAWAVGRLTAWPRMSSLYAGAGVVAVVTGVARVLMATHWFTDVVAGLAVGTLWLTAMIWVGSGCLASSHDDRADNHHGGADPR